jgi:hypothetical protein
VVTPSYSERLIGLKNFLTNGAQIIWIHQELSGQPERMAGITAAVREACLALHRKPRASLSIENRSLARSPSKIEGPTYPLSAPESFVRSFLRSGPSYIPT